MPPQITVINHTAHMRVRKSPIQYIILHYSASTRSGNGSAQGTVSTLDQRGFSSDYAVDDNVILQFADDPAKWRSTACQSWSSKTGTAAGQYAKNDNAVSIEMSSSLEKGGKWVPNDPHFKFTDAVLTNTGWLCGILVAKYKIPKQNIIRHFDIMGKLCPGIIGWNIGTNSPNDNAYRNFVNAIYSTFLPQALMALQGGSVQFNTAEIDYSSMGGGGEGGSSGGGGSYSAGPVGVSYGASNEVYKLSDATRPYDNNIMKPADDRKGEFEALRTQMTNSAPNMGRKIFHTAQLYDSNILKGDQESKTDRTWRTNVNKESSAKKDSKDSKETVPVVVPATGTMTKESTTETTKTDQK